MKSVRAALAESIGLRALPRLEASFDVSRHGREGLHVVGRVSATVGQNCVVTLEPIDSEIDEAVDLVFEPGVRRRRHPHEDGGGSKVAIDDAPEPLVGGVVDLGVVATEFLTLGIDPYPRKSDAEFTAPAAGDRYLSSVCSLGRAQERAGRFVTAPHWHRASPAGYGQSRSALPDDQRSGGGRRAFKVVHAG